MTKKLLCIATAVGTLFFGNAVYAQAEVNENENPVVSSTQDTTAMIIPKPYSVQKGTDAPFIFKSDMCVAVSSDSLNPAVTMLKENLQRVYGVALKVAESGTCPVSYTLNDTVMLPENPAVTNKSLQNNEAYSLKVTHDGVHVTSAGVRGAIWATQSLFQLLGPWAQSQVRLQGEAQVPSVTIYDAPRYAYRGFMLDPVRSFYPVDEVKRIIDIMSYMKMNVLHLHLADNQGWRIAIDNENKSDGDTIDYTRLTEISGKTAFNEGWSRFNPAAGRSGYYTKEQFIDLVKYAALHGIGVLPEIDGPGHSAAMLHAIPQLNTADSTPKPEEGKDTAELTKANWGKFSLATKADVTYTFMNHVMKQIGDDIAKGIAESKVPEVAQNYFHMGGDEVVLPENTPNRAETTRVAMQTYLGKVAKLTTAMKKTPIVWNDGLAAANVLPDGSVVQVWVGKPDGNGGALQKFVKAHHGKVIMSTTKTSYLVQKGSPEVVAPDYACRKVGCTTRDYYNWDPTFNAKVQETDMLGTESAVWTEHLRTLHDTEFMMYPRFFANAEVAWTQNSLKDYNNWALRVGNLGIALINNGNTFQLTTSKEIPNWHGEYRAAYVNKDQTVGQKVLVGVLAQPGLTSTDGIHVQAQFTDEATKKVTELPVTVDMDQVFHYQNPTESKDRYMNSVAKLMVTIPESLRGSVGVLQLTGKSDDSNRDDVALVAGTAISSSAPLAIQGEKDSGEESPSQPAVPDPADPTPAKPDPNKPAPVPPTEEEPVTPTNPDMSKPSKPAMKPELPKDKAPSKAGSPTKKATSTSKVTKHTNTRKKLAEKRVLAKTGVNTLYIVLAAVFALGLAFVVFVTKRTAVK